MKIAKIAATAKTKKTKTALDSSAAAVLYYQDAKQSVYYYEGKRIIMDNDQNNNPVAGQPAAQSNDEILQGAVDTASDLLVVARNQSDTAIALINTPDNEKEVIKRFISRVNLQIDSSKKVKSLALAKAKQRNEGRHLPPSKQPKSKTENKTAGTTK